MARHTTARRWPTLTIAGLLLVVAALGVGAYSLGWVDYWRAGTPEAPAAEPLSITAHDPGPTTVAAAAPQQAPDAAAIRKALKPRVDDDRLGGRVAVQVAALTTDTAAGPAWKRGDWASTPASTTKLLTATAVLSTLGPDHTFTTTVTRSGQRLTLKGGGDPLLSSEDLERLAEHTARRLDGAGIGQVRLVYDNSLFSGPSVDPHWEDDYVTDEVVAPVSALMVDESRSPGPDGVLASDDDGRYTRPAVHAAEVFADALENAGVRVKGTPSAGAAQGKQIADLQSRPLNTILEHVLQFSSNEPAEVLARHVGLAAGDSSFTGSEQAIRDELRALGIGVDGLELYDGSGLSRDNRIPARLLRQVLQLAASPDHPELAAVLTGLPVSGFDGTATYRFVQDAEPARGLARLKTGTLTGVHSYAGVVEDANGTPMVVVLMADRVSDVGSLDARDALDDAVAALTTCDCS